MALAAKQTTAGSVAKRASQVNRPAVSRAALVVRAQQQNGPVEDMSRRGALGMLAGVAALVSSAPAQAAYGDSANVFGKVTNKSGFLPYAGEGFTVAVPSKWNPSKEREYPNMVLRYEDNFDAVNNAMVLVLPTDKSSIEGYGSPDKLVADLAYLLGKQAFEGETISEGGFAPGRVAAASLLEIGESTDAKGKKYYEYQVLTRSADGDEGGRHQVFKATVSNGKLYVLKVQVGDKRWFKGVDKEAAGMAKSFVVA